jgi:DNA (cytosine-5)-methyltransferase 1
VEAIVSELRYLRERIGMSRAELAAALGYSSRQVQRWEQSGAGPKAGIRDRIMQILDKRSNQVNEESGFRFIDLFAGIGGLRRPFDEIGGTCVFTSEWDKYAQITYRANFGSAHDIAGDITRVPTPEIPRHDLLLAGFPCQPFSIAGVSKKNALGRPHGFADLVQGTLFFDVARIIEYHRPLAFVLENVKNLLTHDGGRTFNTIVRVLTAELGYSISYRVIDARAYVPQHRERVIIVGFRDPVPLSLEELELPSIDAHPTLASILHSEDAADISEPYTLADGRVHPKYTLTDNLWRYLQDYAAKHRAKGNGFGYGLVGPSDVARTLSARYYKDGSEILVDRGNNNPRRLTPRECARLMGFDSGRNPTFDIPVSDTQAYKQFGNSVAVPVIRAVAHHIRPYLLGESERSQLALPLSFAHG